MTQRSDRPNLSSLPELPLEEWESSKRTLHLYMQIIGKVRLQLTPRKNHWWNVTLYPGTTGMTTGPIPTADGFGVFEVTLNFVEHQLEVVGSDGFHGAFELVDGLSVATFYQKVRDLLRDAGVEMDIVDRPFDVPGITEPFSRLDAYSSYQKDYVERFWQILLWVGGVFREFSGGFYGKTCPVHLYWHHMDLTVTRFSGKKGPVPPAGMSVVEKDAYSHEVVSFGFWAGDEQVRQPAFYSYAYPSPDGLGKTVLAPAKARWVESNGSYTATLFYDDLRDQTDPRAVLLEFLESAYANAAGLAGWPIEELAVPPLSDL